MRKLSFIAIATSIAMSAGQAFAGCHEPELPWPNDGSCAFDVICIFERSGDMHEIDGVKMHHCQIGDYASFPAIKNPPVVTKKTPPKGS